MLSLLVSTSAFGCTFNSSDSQLMREVTKAHGGYPVSDAQCAFLNKKDLALSVSGDATVLSGAAVAWAQLRLRDLKTGVVSDLSRYSTYVNTKQPSQDYAQDLLFNAMTDAIAAFDFEAAAGQIEQYAAKSNRRKK